VALGDVRAGAVVRRLLPASAGTGMQVSGLALHRAGDLWITYSRLPRAGDPAVGVSRRHTPADHYHPGRHQRCQDDVLAELAGASVPGAESAADRARTGLVCTWRGTRRPGRSTSSRPRLGLTASHGYRCWSSSSLL
jgi:hypothetical protein